MTNKNTNPAILNPNGQIEITEFFDYNCGHCKKELKIIDELITRRNDVRVVLRAIPILGQSSMFATQIGHGIMISEPEKYLKYFRSIMDNFGYEGDPIQKALDDSDIDRKKLQDTLGTKIKEIGSMIKENADLADKYKVQGTPAFIINDKLVSGAIDIDTLIALLKK